MPHHRGSFSNPATGRLFLGLVITLSVTWVDTAAAQRGRPPIEPPRNGFRPRIKPPKFEFRQQSESERFVESEVRKKGSEPGRTRAEPGKSERSAWEVAHSAWKFASGLATGWASTREKLGGSIWESARVERPFVRERVRVERETPRTGPGPGPATFQGDLRPPRPEACVILPEGEGAFRGVFGPEPTEAQMEQIKDYHEKFKREGVEILGSEATGEAALEAKVRDMAARGAWPIVVIGHSEFIGGEQVLFLPSGDAVPIARIHRWATEAGAPGLVLTCHGRDFGLDEKIGYDDALAMWQEVEAMRAAGAGPGATPIVEGVIARMTSTRWERGASKVHVTASTPPGRPLGGMPSSPGEVVIWEFPMERPNRSLAILALAASGLGLLHYTMWRISRRGLIAPRPTTWESFRLAMMAAFRSRKLHKRLGLELAAFTLLMAGTAILLGSELIMDWGERRLGMRQQVYLGSVLGSLPAMLACLVYLTNPLRSWFGTLAHGLGGALTGATWGWAFSVIMSLMMGVVIGIGAAIIGTIAWIIGGSGGLIEGLGFGFVMAISFGMFFGLGVALAGIFVGWCAAVEGESVHERIAEYITESFPSSGPPSSHPCSVCRGSGRQTEALANNAGCLVSDCPLCSGTGRVR